MTIHINGTFAFYTGLFVSLGLIFAGALLLPDQFPSVHENVGVSLEMFGSLFLGCTFGFGASELLRD